MFIPTGFIIFNTVFFALSSNASSVAETPHCGYLEDGKNTMDNDIDDAMFKGAVEVKVQVRDIERHGRHFEPHEVLKAPYPEKVELLLKSTTSSHVLKLSVSKNSDILSNRYIKKLTSAPNGTSVNELSNQHCFYHGKINGCEKSYLAVNVCDGDVSGSLSVTPFDVPSTLHTADGVVKFTNRGFDSDPFEKVYEKVRDRCHSMHSRAKRRADVSDQYEDLVTWPQKYVELAIVHTFSNYAAYHYDQALMIDHTKKIVNLLNQFYYPLNIKFALVEIEIWTVQYDVHATTSVAGSEPFDQANLDARGVLDQFARYRHVTLLRFGENDNAQLLTGRRMAGGVVGKAFLHSMCSDSQSVGINYDADRQIPSVASTMAHEIGHNFDLSHDNKSCFCPNGPHEPCIMSAVTREGHAISTWSQCSVRAFANTINAGLAPCIDYPPGSDVTLYGSPTCQNGFVEEGEECDCGKEADTECMRCCNARTCKLLPDKQCANGDCCDTTTCTFLPEASQCRGAAGTCDLPEYCSGKAQFCPFDVFKRNGLTCQSDAYCYDGECSSASDHCEAIWGPGSFSSKPGCYSKNRHGTSTGFCEEVSNGETYTYIPCADEDELCGLVNCENRNYEKPKKGSVNYMVGGYGVVGDCASVSFQPMSRVRQPGLVPNGASCGSNKMCKDSKCISVNGFLSTTNKDVTDACRKNCSDNGVCNSLGQCHCDPGYGSDDCGGPGLGGSAHSNSAGLDRQSLNVPVAVGIMLLFIVVLTIFITIMYRKREKFRKYESTWPFKLLFMNSAQPIRRRYDHNMGPYLNAKSNYVPPYVPPVPENRLTLDSRLPVPGDLPPAYAASGYSGWRPYSTLSDRSFDDDINDHWNQAPVVAAPRPTRAPPKPPGPRAAARPTAVVRSQGSQRPNVPPPVRPQRPDEETLKNKVPLYGKFAQGANSSNSAATSSKKPFAVVNPVRQNKPSASAVPEVHIQSNNPSALQRRVNMFEPQLRPVGRNGPKPQLSAKPSLDRSDSASTSKRPAVAPPSAPAEATASPELDDESEYAYDVISEPQTSRSNTSSDGEKATVYSQLVKPVKSKTDSENLYEQPKSELAKTGGFLNELNNTLKLKKPNGSPPTGPKPATLPKPRAAPPVLAPKPDTSTSPPRKNSVNVNELAARFSEKR